MTPIAEDHNIASILSGRMPEPDRASLSPAAWDRIVGRAQAEGVAPLLYWTLSRSERIDLLPEALQKSLRAMYVGTRMKNEQILNELEMLTRLFSQAGIPVVALKGVCFALTIYPDLGLRPMVDLDLLVPASKVLEAVRIARASGYVEAVPDASPGLGNLLNHEVCLRKSESPYTVLELHHSLVADKTFVYAVPVDWFWKQTEPITGSSSGRGLENLLVLTPTAQLLYACAHAMLQHGGRNTSLRWYYDLDRLVRTHAERLAWELLLTQARSFAWSSAVEAALSQTVALFETPVPQDVLVSLRKEFDRNADRVEMMQGRPTTHTLEEYQKLKSLSWHGRFRLALALAIPGPAYMRWRYGLKNPWELPVYYIHRWWGILKDALRTAFLLIRRKLSQKPS